MKRHLLIYGGAFALYIALLAVTWLFGTHNAWENTEAELDYTANDIRTTTAGALNLMLESTANCCVRYFGKVATYTRSEMQAAADLFGLDELNIIGRDGLVLATNDPDCEGVDFNAKEITRAFLVLTNGTTRVVAQPFRSHAYGAMRRKYIGVPFPGGDGLLQVGMDESRLEMMIPTELAFLFDARMGDTVCYLCANAKTGEIVSQFLKDDDEKSIFAAGFDPAMMPQLDPAADNPEKAQSGVTIETTLFGQEAFCRAHLLGGHIFIEAGPKSMFFGARNVMTIAIAILLAFVLGAFAYLLVRITDDAKRIKAFYAAQETTRAKEMEIAKNIQTSALPAPLAANPYFHMAASMTPAREVGGDFYDFFMLDSTHLAFLIADVSGKGITGALYMMTAKTVIKNAILETRDPSAAFTQANAELCRSNTANMFLTAWCGILDLETGDVTFVNAGHNPPVMVKEQVSGGRGQVSGDSGQVSGGMGWLYVKSGPMLAFMDGITYKAHTTHLKPGDVIFLYTDGVTEAMDNKGELFGDDRLATTLSVITSSEPKAVCDVVRTAVAAFTAGAPAADDLTVLAVKYVRRPNRYVRSFPPTQDGIAAASEHLDESIEKATESNNEIRYKSLSPSLHVILDEIASNIVKHSQASGFEIDIEFLVEPLGIKLTFIDDGTPYNPLAHIDPDTTLPAEERPIGGLGILMVKKMSNSVSYERTHNRNLFSVTCNVKLPA